MKMKNTISGLLLMVIFSPLFSQPPGERGENIRAIKIGFITQRLNLSPAEAEKFWPVYNQYEAEMDALRKDRREETMVAKINFDDMSDAEVEKLVNDLMAMEQSKVNLQVKYIGEFKKILPIKKVAMLMKAEKDFRQKIIDTLRDRQQGKGPGGPRAGEPVPGSK